MSPPVSFVAHYSTPSFFASNDRLSELWMRYRDEGKRGSTEIPYDIAVPPTVQPHPAGPAVSRLPRQRKRGAGKPGALCHVLWLDC